MQADKSKKRMKLVIEGTATWICGQKKKTQETLRKTRLGLQCQTPFFPLTIPKILGLVLYLKLSGKIVD